MNESHVNWATALCESSFWSYIYIYEREVRMVLSLGDYPIDHVDSEKMSGVVRDVTVLDK